MASLASGLLAAAILLPAGALLVTHLVRLALAAHHADDRGFEPVPWPLPVAAAVGYGLGALLRVARYASNSAPSVPELVLQAGLDAASSLLLATFLARTARSRFGGELEGRFAGGAILFASALASTILVLGKGTFSTQVQISIAVSLGALAWALFDLALFANAARVAPAWIRAFATLGSQAIVFGVWLRALIAGPDTTSVTRVLVALTWLLPVLLAGACFAGVRDALRASAEDDESRGHAARSPG